MTDPARISVVVPCFNAAEYIGVTLRSVLAQEVVELEVIVVDDGSTDASADVVRDGFPGVRLLHQANQGVAAARNLGIAHATGDWVAFVDADDVWLPGKLVAQMAALSAVPTARMSYTAWCVWACSSPEPPTELLASLQAASLDEARWAGASGWIYPELLLDCVVWTSTVLVQRSLLDELGGFDASLRIGEDYDLWLRASRVTPIVRVPRPLALYRQHPASITRRAPERNWQGLVVERALARWGVNGPDGRRGDAVAVNRALARTWRDFAGAHLATGNAGIARAAGWRAVRYDWTAPGAWKLLARSLMPSPLRSGGSK